MQVGRAAVLLALVAAVALPAPARAQGGNGDVQGFGGPTAGTSTFGTAVSFGFGGHVGIGLNEHLQIVGEAGRLARVESPTFDVLDFTNLRVDLDAFYGEGGVRVLGANPRSAVRPYGEAAFGFAKLSADIVGLDDAEGPLVEAARDLLNMTRPMFGAGGGILIDAGPVSVDVGYRYKQISTGDEILSALNEGKNFHINQVRIGVGFRF